MRSRSCSSFVLGFGLGVGGVSEGVGRWQQHLGWGRSVNGIVDSDDGIWWQRKRSGRKKDGQCRVGRIGVKNGLMMDLTGCIACSWYYYMDPWQVAFL